MWGLYDGDTCIGLTWLYAIPEETDAVMFVASYIRDEYRKMGLSKLYYEARLAWALERGYKRARIGHRAGNEASKAANQKFGFQYTHSVSMTWHDGTQADDVYYQLLM
jgi:RimJ/RimL family protein N-acetyltransferase